MGGRWLLESEYRWWLVGLGVVGLAVLVVTYRGIFQRSERRLTWALMALRGVGLLALFLALAKPTWTRESRLVDPGRVAVVLDTSQSMGLPDAGGQRRYARARELVGKLGERLRQGTPRLDIDVVDINGAPLEAGDLPAQPTAERTDLVRAVL